MCGKINGEEDRSRRSTAIVSEYGAYRDSPLDTKVKERLDWILSVSGIPKKYQFEFKLKHLEPKTAIDALNRMYFSSGTGTSAGLIVSTLSRALRSAREKGQIQAPLPPPESTAVSGELRQMVGPLKWAGRGLNLNTLQTTLYNV